MKRTIAILLAVLMLAVVFVGCGEDNSAENTGATPDTAVSTKPAETTVVLETTAQGGTIEKDAQENTIERDKSGTIVSVKDKSGNTVSVTEYTKAHPDIADPSGGSKSSDSDKKSDAGAKTDTPSKTDGKDQTEAADPTEGQTEEEIPQVIVDLSDDDKEIIELDLD